MKQKENVLYVGYLYVVLVTNRCIMFLFTSSCFQQRLGLQRRAETEIWGTMVIFFLNLFSHTPGRKSFLQVSNALDPGTVTLPPGYGHFFCIIHNSELLRSFSAPPRCSWLVPLLQLASTSLFIFSGHLPCALCSLNSTTSSTVVSLLISSFYTVPLPLISNMARFSVGT